MAEILTCTNISMKYESAYALKDVSFGVDQCDYLCVVGENGSGKTTLMKIILGLIRPDSGTVQYRSFKQSEIGYLPQQTAVQKDFPASVYEVVLSGCLNRHKAPFYTKRDKMLARENLKRLNAESYMNKSYRDLSGGQQQRVLLARALCATEKILLLDEPVTGLDPMMATELYELLAKLNKQGLTIIMISHDIKSAVQYGNKILHLSTEPLFFGTTEDYLQCDIGIRMTGGEAHA